MRRLSRRPGRVTRWTAQIARVPALLAGGIRDATSLVRPREPGLLGALAWWAFDIAPLWACFRAFGGSPEIALLVMAYFVGMTLWLPLLPGGLAYLHAVDLVRREPR